MYSGVVHNHVTRKVSTSVRLPKPDLERLDAMVDDSTELESRGHAIRVAVRRMLQNEFTKG